MMTTYCLKLVSEDAPNEPGHWVECDLDEPPTYETVVKPGYRIVQIGKGPMNTNSVLR